MTRNLNLRELHRGARVKDTGGVHHASDRRALFVAVEGYPLRPRGLVRYVKCRGLHVHSPQLQLAQRLYCPRLTARRAEVLPSASFRQCGAANQDEMPSPAIHQPPSDLQAQSTEPPCYKVSDVCAQSRKLSLLRNRQPSQTCNITTVVTNRHLPLALGRPKRFEQPLGSRVV